MNHNSFPSGERALGQQDNEDATEFPSFEEHMQQMEQSKTREKENLIGRAKKIINRILHSKFYAEQDVKTLNRPTIKNCKDMEEVTSIYGLLPHGSEDAVQKVLNNEPLQTEDIMSMATIYGGQSSRDGMKQFINDSGIGSGKNFDISLPKYLYGQDGEGRRTPLSISFENEHGTYTRIDIFSTEDARGGVRTTAVSYEGSPEQGVDVAYRGNLSLEDKETTQEAMFQTEPFYPKQN